MGPAQQRLVLATLALSAGSPVTSESLIDCVWDRAPHGARRTLHVLISRIRRLMDSVPACDDIRLLRRSGGYVLQIPPDRVDAHRFSRLTTEAAAPGLDPGERAVLLSEALQLWRGEPLAGLPGDWAARTRQEWRQRHISAAVDWAGYELATGRTNEVVGPLAALTGEYPLEEPLTEALMRALCAAGRSAEAVQSYTRFQARLASELGIDPDPRLQSLYLAALRGEVDGAYALTSRDR
ncbi:AfsR/SARP family transcriptional regulator [Micromonospora tulbaghiae]|uniref:AfsR/SARP family transcriptional regulator n=1 Tax=Micromonospora tulbaghiae TaxID=479978 RepID=UPI0015EF4A52|nr:BTAD domain-containing putative transcriptional regulator [Micromonospora provocatoris]